MHPSSRSETVFEDVRTRTRQGLSEAVKRLSELIGREDELLAMIERGVEASGWTEEEREQWWKDHPRPTR